jgi:hypothetical protein
MFKKPVKSAQQGDRVGICVAGLDPTSVERGIVAAPGSVPLLSSAICLVKKVRFYKQSCKTKQKLHVSIGHSTVVATVTYFGAKELAADMMRRDKTLICRHRDSHSAAKGPSLHDRLGVSTNRFGILVDKNGFPIMDFPWDTDYEYQDELIGSYETLMNALPDSESADAHSSSSAVSVAAELQASSKGAGEEIESTRRDGSAARYGDEAVHFALLEFQHPVLCPSAALVIGSRLETDAKENVVNSTNCRIAFFGPVLCSAGDSGADLNRLRIYTWKQKEAEILRLTDVRKDTGLCMEAIGWKLFNKEAGIGRYLGMKLETPSGDVVGFIHSPFGATGKFKIRFPLGVTGLRFGSRLVLKFKRFVYDRKKVMHQDASYDYTPLSDRNALSAQEALVVEASEEPTDAEAEESPDALNESDDDDIEAKVGIQGVDVSEISLSVSAPESNAEVLPSAAKLDEERSFSLEDIQKETFASGKMSHSVEISGNVAASLEQKSELHAPVTSFPSAEVSPPAVAPMEGRSGTVESVKVVGDEITCIVSGAFKIEENIRSSAGAAALGPGQISGTMTGPYAKMGKCKVVFNAGGALIKPGDVIQIFA